MENLRKDSDLFYIPNPIIDDCLFDGVPFPTKEAYELLGEKTIQDIHQKFATMLQWRKEMLSHKHKELYGFDVTQSFLDVQSKVVFNITKALEEDTNAALSSLETPLEGINDKSLIIPSTFQKRKSLKEIQSKDNYTIKKWRKFKMPKGIQLSAEQYYKKHF